MVRKLTQHQLDAVFATPVHGDFGGDAALWFTLDAIIIDDRYDMATRAKASRMVGAIIGEDDDEFAGDTDADRVAKHSAIIREFLEK